MKCDTGDIARMAFKGKDRIGIRGFDVIELYIMVTCRSEISFVGGDTKSIYL
jgi:hypothetical protein